MFNFVDMNSTEIFSLALGLSNPWFVKHTEFNSVLTGKKELHIHIGFVKGSKFLDELGELCSVYDSNDRKWRHLSFFQHDCYLHCDVPRIKSSTGKVTQVAVPWAREGSGFTLLFEAFAMQLIEYEMPVSNIGNLLGEQDNRIWRIFNYWITIAYSKANHSKIKKIGIDETSTKKGHNYVTLGVDLEHRNVFHAVPGKDAATIHKIKDYLESKQTKAEEIQQISIDLSPAFISGSAECFPNASITFDRFHVKKLLNQAMDTVRKNERKDHEILKGHRYLFLKNNANLSQRQIDEREKYLTLLPNLGTAYRLKELFDDFWDMKDVDEAAGFLQYWADLVKDSGIQPFIKFTNTLFSHWSGIVNYINTRINNGVLEGINSKIQLAKKRARGYRNITNFINMIYFLTGKLKFNYPL